MDQRPPSQFTIYEGTVVSIQRWSDTHISSSGGGGYVDPKFGGHVAAPQLNSQIVQRAEVFIKDKIGMQHALKLSDTGIPLTDGNQIIAVMDERWQGGPRVLYLENLDTRMTEAPLISTGLPQRSLWDGFGKGFVWGVVGSLLGLVGGFNFFMNAGWFFSCLIGIPAWWLANSLNSSKRLSDFNAHNAAFLLEIREVASQIGINITIESPVFGPLRRTT